MTPGQIERMTSQDWEPPAFPVGQRVVHPSSGRTGFVQGYFGWNPPVLLYGMKFDNADDEMEWLSQSDIRAAE